MATPATPDRPTGDATEPVVPNPHRGEPMPPAPEGMRPEAAAAREAALAEGHRAVLPEQDEPGGPLGGLVGASSAKVAEEATPGGDAGAEALLAQMGVEEEGIESGQLLGFVAATILSVIALAAVIIYLIYAPFRSATEAEAENVTLYPELQQSRVDGRAKLDQATRSGDVYTVPIGRAMSLVAAEYRGAGADSAAAGAGGAGQLSRAEFNTLMVNRTAGVAVQDAGVGRGQAPAATGVAGSGTAAATDSTAFGPTRPQTSEEVGVDDNADNPEAPEPRPDIE